MPSPNTDLHIDVGSRIGKVSGILLRPADAWAGHVLAHGAGAGMRHRFIEGIAQALAGRGMATLRYQFPYIETGGRRPDPPGKRWWTACPSWRSWPTM